MPSQYKYPFTIDYTQGMQLTARMSPQSAHITHPVNAFYIMNVPPGSDGEIIKQLERISGITVAKAHSWDIAGGTDLHITHKLATKEHAVAELCKMLGVSARDCAGVGDGFNDIYLFNAVGHKVAMGNAVPELKAAADEVIETVDDNGLGRFILWSAHPSGHNYRCVA